MSKDTSTATVAILVAQEFKQMTGSRARYKKLQKALAHLPREEYNRIMYFLDYTDADGNPFEVYQ